MDSWRRKVDENGKEFISFRIISKFENGEEEMFEKRYSEFYQLNQTVQIINDSIFNMFRYWHVLILMV